MEKKKVTRNSKWTAPIQQVSIETHLNSLIKVLRLLIEFVSRVIKKICKIFESQFSFLIFFFFVNVAGEILVFNTANFDKKKQIDINLF
jgi:hypothetical protein